MYLQLPVLKQNENITIDDLRVKLIEESKEVSDVRYISSPFFKENSIEELYSEIFDTIQVCIGLLDLLGDGEDAILQSYKHIDKLRERKWEFKETLVIKKGSDKSCL